MKAFFQPAQQPGGQGDHDQIVGTHGDEDFGEAEGVRGHHLAFAHQFHAGHQIGQGAVLDQIDDFIAAAGQGPAAQEKSMKEDS